MATLLSFHLLGLYPVPSTTQLLVLSPFTPRYTIHNSFLNISTTVTVVNFSPRSVRREIPFGVPAYVKSVTINGKPSTSRCYFDFYDVFRLGGDIVITLTADKTAVDSCEGGVPESLSTGGFATARWLMKISCEFCSLSSVESIIVFMIIYHVIDILSCNLIS